METFASWVGEEEEKNGSGGGFPDEMKQLYENQDKVIRLLTHQFGHLIRSKAETLLDPNLLCLFIPIVQNRPAAYKTRAGVMVYMRPGPDGASLLADSPSENQITHF